MHLVVLILGLLSESWAGELDVKSCGEGSSPMLPYLRYLRLHRRCALLSSISPLKKEYVLGVLNPPLFRSPTPATHKKNT